MTHPDDDNLIILKAAHGLRYPDTEWNRQQDLIHDWINYSKGGDTLKELHFID